MQNAKDSFYIALRDRLAVLNSARTLQVRAVTRPGIMVEEAEAPDAEILSDVFTLRWTLATVVESFSNALLSLVCEVHYATSGSQANSGLDRGRAMAEMDHELMSFLQPMCTRKLCYTSTPPIAMQTNVFWTEPVVGPLQSTRNRLMRTSTITVYVFEEPGEL